MLNKTICIMVIGIMGSGIFFGGNMKNAGAETKAGQVSAAVWEKLSAKKIYFGHQSVGGNIMDGINKLAQTSGTAINIKETKNAVDFNQPIFAHSAVGENYDPISKINDFKAIMDSGLGDRVDIAFFKFCYVDVTLNADINKIFNHYVETMAQLERAYPNTRFIHCTVPLQQAPTGVKTMLKQMLGKSSSGIDDNIQRNKFNQMLRDKYGQSGRLFDLAAGESTYPDGKRQTFDCKGRKYFSLMPEYTDDGGHLNAKGRDALGQQMVLFLQTISGEKS